MADEVDRRGVISLRGGRSIDDVIELDFITLDGKALYLQFPSDLLETINSQIVEALDHHRRRTLHTHDHEAVRASQCANISAVAAAGGEVIILSITDIGGVVHRFAVTAAQSAGLRPSLRAAEQEANRQNRGTKQ